MCGLAVRTRRRRRRRREYTRRRRRRGGRTTRAEPSVRAPVTCVPNVRFSEVGEARAIANIPADPAARRSPGGESRRGGRTGTHRSTEREPVTVCRHNLGGRPGRVPGRTANLTLARRRPGPVVRGARARRRRSGRVSGIRPSDRRGPGPVGHRGRNVRSTGRCSYNLRITRRRADSCGLHRSTSQVIRRSGSGVFFFFEKKKIFFFVVRGFRDVG